MSAKIAKPTQKAISHHYAFQMPDGKYIGRCSFHDELSPQPPRFLVPYSTLGIAARRAAILARFPTAKIVPAPRWNDETHEYETPVNVPNLN